MIHQYTKLVYPEYSCKKKVKSTKPTTFCTDVGTSNKNCKIIPKKNNPNKKGVFQP